MEWELETGREIPSSKRSSPIAESSKQCLVGVVSSDWEVESDHWKRNQLILNEGFGLELTSEPLSESYAWYRIPSMR